MEREPVFTDYEVNDAGENVLPTYCGYTVDVRERGFYRICDDDLEYYSFESADGSILLLELLEVLPRESRLYKKLSELNLTQGYSLPA
jgi:hypothetical protein